MLATAAPAGPGRRHRCSHPAGSEEHIMTPASSTGPHQPLAPDPSWRPLYRAGALAAALAVLLYLLALGLYVTTAAPPSGDGAAVPPTCS
jgi:hypothetical protein